MTALIPLAARASRMIATGLATTAFAVACARAPESKVAVAVDAPRAGELYVVHDTTIDAQFDAGGVAAPVRQATLSTRLMGTVTDVRVVVVGP